MKLRSSLLSITVLAAAGALALTGCASGGGDTAPTTPAAESSGNAEAEGSALETLTAGTLTVCSDIPYEPFEFLDGDKAVGFDIDIVQAIADANDLTLKVIDSSFDAITSGLFKSQCDIAASSISITDERKQNVDFSDPYYDDDLVLVTPVGSDITSVETAAGANVGVQSGTTGESYGADKGLTTVGFEDSGLQIQALISGQTAASLGNQSVLKYAIKGNDGFEVVEEISTGEQLGIAVPKGATAMLDAVNATLAELKSSGKLEELEKQWFEGE